MTDQALQVSAGGALLRLGTDAPQLLVMRRRARVYELPKGHVETGESLAQAAARELCEETGLRQTLTPCAALGAVAYRFDGRPPVRKVVHFFLFVAEAAALDLGPRPAGIRELRWVRWNELGDLPLASENLRPVLRAAFEQQRPATE